MDSQRIKQLKNLDPSSFDFSNLKAAIEYRDEIYEALDQFNSKAELNERESRVYNSLVMKAKKFENGIERAKDEEQKRAANAVPYGSDEPSTKSGRLNGGKALNEKGNIRLYKPGETMHNPYEGNVDLGSYLRAIVDKPRNAAERQVLQNSVTSGDYELPTQIAAELIDQLRAVNPLLMEGGAGARTISIDGGDTKFIKITGDPTAVWHAEMTEETPDDPTFDSATFSPKTVLAMTEIGRETLQDSANVEEALSTAFVGSLNEAILNATFTGAGGSDEPEGLSSTVTQTDTYTNGGDPDWSNYVAASKTLHDNNVPAENRSFIHAPDVWQTMALIQDSNNRYQDAPSFIRDVPNFVTSGVSDGEAYVGDFSNVVYGFRLNITLEQFPAAAAKSYGSLWVAAARLDIATFRPNALVRIEEATA